MFCPKFSVAYDSRNCALSQGFRTVMRFGKALVLPFFHDAVVVRCTNQEQNQKTDLDISGTRGHKFSVFFCPSCNLPSPGFSLIFWFAFVYICFQLCLELHLECPEDSRRRGDQGKSGLQAGRVPKPGQLPAIATFLPQQCAQRLLAWPFGSSQRWSRSWGSAGAPESCKSNYRLLYRSQESNYCT